MSLLPGKFYLDDFFDDFGLDMPRMPRMDIMKCDIYETDGKINIEMDIPGFNKDDIKIDVEDGILTIEGVKNNEQEEKNKKYVRKERVYGSFKRQFTIGDINEDEINAKFNNGVLTIDFPKEQEKKETKKFIDIK